MQSRVSISRNNFNALRNVIDIICLSLYNFPAKLQRFFMDISIRKLSTIFTLAAGITAGGIIGVGTVAHQYSTPGVETTHRAHANGNTPERGSAAPAAATDVGIPAEVLRTDKDVTYLRAHTWVGQFTLASVCSKTDTSAEKACHYAADMTDENGAAVTNPRRGQMIYLHGLEETGESRVPAPRVIDIPGIRPRSDVVPGPVRAHVVKTVDGDTFEVMAEIWKGTYVLTDIRVNGIDTPEKKGRAKCDSEAALAERASAATKELIYDKDVLLFNVQYEKYGGRVLGDVKTLDGRSVADNLVQKNLAKPYDGGTKQSWCR